MGVREGCSHEKFETLAVVDCLLTNRDGITRTSFYHILQEDRLKSRVKILPNIFEEHPFPKLYSQLYGSHEVWLSGFNHRKSFFVFGS